MGKTYKGKQNNNRTIVVPSDTERTTRSLSSLTDRANKQDNISQPALHKPLTPNKRVRVTKKTQSGTTAQVQGKPSNSVTLDEQLVTVVYGTNSTTLCDNASPSLQTCPSASLEEPITQEIDMHIPDKNDDKQSTTSSSKEINKPTNLFAAVSYDSIKGNSKSGKIETMNKLFMHILSYKGTHIRDLKKQKYICVTFTNQEDLNNALKIDIPAAPTDEIPERVIKLQKWLDIKPPASVDLIADQNARTIQVIDIPLDFKSPMITAAFRRYGTIEKLTMRTKNLYQQAFIRFAEAESIQHFMDSQWCTFIKNHAVRVLPLSLSQEKRQLRQKFCHKLAGIPRNCLAGDLFEFLKSIHAKTCFIPRNLHSYSQQNYAFVNFECQEDFDNAPMTSYTLQGHILFWCNQKDKTCFTCGSPNHSVKVCPKRQQSRDPHKLKLQKLYQRFRPAQHRRTPQKQNRQQNKPSYAEMAKKPKPHPNNTRRPWNQSNIRRSETGVNNNLSFENTNNVDKLYQILQYIEEQFGKLDKRLTNMEKKNIPPPSVNNAPNTKSQTKQLSPTLNNRHEKRTFSDVDPSSSEDDPDSPASIRKDLNSFRTTVLNMIDDQFHHTELGGVLNDDNDEFQDIEAPLIVMEDEDKILT